MLTCTPLLNHHGRPSLATHSPFTACIQSPTATANPPLALHKISGSRYQPFIHVTFRMDHNLRRDVSHDTLPDFTQSQTDMGLDHMAHPMGFTFNACRIGSWDRDVSRGRSESWWMGAEPSSAERDPSWARCCTGSRNNPTESVGFVPGSSELSRSADSATKTAAAS